MKPPRPFLESSLGQKVLMAVTGLCLVGFVIAHLLGNLSFLGGHEAFNAYAHKLEDLGPLLWVGELLILALFLIHISLAIRLTQRSRAARPEGYRMRESLGQASAGSRSMLVTGLVLLGFLVIHIADFRIKKLLGDPEVADLAEAVATRITSPVGFLIYAIGILALGLHLSHAVQSSLQTLGLNHPKHTGLMKKAGRGLAALLTIGFLAIPIFLLMTGQGGAR